MFGCKSLFYSARIRALQLRQTSQHFKEPIMAITRFLVSLAYLFASSAVAGEQLPIFDGHIHFNSDAQQRYSPDAALKILDDAGITRALCSSTPNQGTDELYRSAPERIVPFLRPYRNEADRSTWFKDPEILAFVAQNLERGIYRGIGEFHVNGRDADSPVVQHLVDLAVEKNLVLHAHSDGAAIETLLRLNPKVKVLWAHAGISAPPSAVGNLLDRYSALWVELSSRVADIAPQGQLDPQWRSLFLRYPDRFIIGTDTWTASRWQELARLTAASREWLAQLPQNVAAQIAHENAGRLFRNEEK
jgi:hypothetical protein